MSLGAYPRGLGCGRVGRRYRAGKDFLKGTNNGRGRGWEAGMESWIVLEISSHDQLVLLIVAQMWLDPDERGSDFIGRTFRLEVDVDQFERYRVTFDLQYDCLIVGG